MPPRANIQVAGLRELRRDLRHMGPEASRQVQIVLKAAAGIVAADARTRAPRLTGALAASIRPGTQGNTAVIRSRLPYASVQEFGGTIAPRGTPIRIKPHEFVQQALAHNTDRVVSAVADGLDAVARRNGWH